VDDGVGDGGVGDHGVVSENGRVHKGSSVDYGDGLEKKKHHVRRRSWRNGYNGLQLL